MRITRLEFERYKGYRRRTVIELRPLTVLVGRNNAGKTALLRAFPLLCGGLAAEKGGAEPLPFASGGIVHGRSFRDVVTDRMPHGHLDLAAHFAHADERWELEARVQNLNDAALGTRRCVARWRIEQQGGARWTLSRRSYRWQEERYESVFSAGVDLDPARQDVDVTWGGLLPVEVGAPADRALQRCRRTLEAMADWSCRLRYLRSPRSLCRAPFEAAEATSQLGLDGRAAARMLAADPELAASVSAWYREAFALDLRVTPQGEYFSLDVTPGEGGPAVAIDQAGQGLAQVLAVAVQMQTAARQGSGLDIIEHPEAELHPGAHAAVAELILSNLVGPERPIVIETHSPTLLLRARRRVAEGKLDPDEIGIWWIDHDDGAASVRPVAVTPRGELQGWPDGVFAEDYDEILAMRRARRAAGGQGR